MIERVPPTGPASTPAPVTAWMAVAGAGVIPRKATLEAPVLPANRQAWAFGKEFIALLRHSQLPRIEGRAGAFFCIYWGEVSEDSDGPVEWCRPVPADEADALAARCPELTLRAEPAHQEAFVKLGPMGRSTAPIGSWSHDRCTPGASSSTTYA